MKKSIVIAGFKFDIEKIGKGYKISYRNHLAFKNTSEKKVVTELKNVNTDKLVSACESVNKKLNKNDYFNSHIKKFTQTFGFKPPKDFLLYSLTNGLSIDVIALDKKLNVPDNISTSDYIKTKYGKDVIDMVKKMI